jgi:GT2 family glycosyltransferase
MSNILFYKIGHSSLDNIKNILEKVQADNNFLTFAVIKEGVETQKRIEVRELLESLNIEFINFNGNLPSQVKMNSDGYIKLLVADEFAKINLAEARNYKFLVDCEIEYFNTEIIHSNVNISIRRPIWSPNRYVSQDYFWDFYAVKVRNLEDLKILCFSLSSWLKSKNYLRTNFISIKHTELIMTLIYLEPRRYLDRTLNIRDTQEISNQTELNLPYMNHNKSDSSVSIIIPTAFAQNRAGEMLVENLLKSLASQLNNNDEVIVVSGNYDDSKNFSELIERNQISVKWVVDSADFNFSRRTNLGAIHAKNEILLFLNDDIEFLSDESIKILANWTHVENVGAVGALLYYPNGKIQHAGHVYSNFEPTHAYYRQSNEPVNGDLSVDREVSGVTAAVLAIKKETFTAIGGFTLALPNSYNDVDLCLKLQSKGLLLIQANSVICLHYESTTRNPETSYFDDDYLKARWMHLMDVEKYTLPPEFLVSK